MVCVATCKIDTYEIIFVCMRLKTSYNTWMTFPQNIVIKERRQNTSQHFNVAVIFTPIKTCKLTGLIQWWCFIIQRASLPQQLDLNIRKHIQRTGKNSVYQRCAVWLPWVAERQTSCHKKLQTFHNMQKRLDKDGTIWQVWFVKICIVHALSKP